MSTHLVFSTADQQTLLQFYSDILSTSVFSNSIAYLSKYPQSTLSNYSLVLHSQQLMKSIVQDVIKSTSEKLSQVKQIVSEHIQTIMEKEEQASEIPQSQTIKLINAISIPIFNRLEEIKTLMILQSISLGSLCVNDVNWKITKTVSSSAKSFVGQKSPYLFNLTICLGQNSDSNNEKSKTINLQMNKIQLKQFLSQLRVLKNDII